MSSGAKIRANKLVALPYNRLYRFRNNQYLDFEIEGVGSKVFLAQLAEEYSTIGIDGVAMVVNDTVRSGATPILLADAIHAERSDKNLLRQLFVGIRHAAEESGCFLISGETGDIPGLLQKQGGAVPFDLVVASLGLARENELIRGQRLEEGDLVIGVKSSGIHSNGLTLARKVLLKKWGGLYKEDTKIHSLSGTVLGELLTPTRIYVAAIKHLRTNVASGVRAAVHVTGDAYLKLSNLFRYNPRVGFDLYNFDVPPIFNLIQDAARRKLGPISDKEMFETFNMGYGFLLVVEKTIADTCIDFIQKRKFDATLIGHVTRDSNRIVVRYRKKKIVLR